MNKFSILVISILLLFLAGCSIHDDDELAEAKALGRTDGYSAGKVAFAAELEKQYGSDWEEQLEDSDDNSGQTDSLTQENEQLKERVDELEAEKASLKTKNDQLKEENDTLKEQLSSSDSNNTVPKEETSQDVPVTTTYVLNTNTKKFHKPNCSSVSDIKQTNREYSTAGRQDLIVQGYSPCGKCNP